MAEAEGRREKDLDLVEEFETVRAVTSDGRSVRIPKSKIGGNLETATETVLGGIKAAAKTEKETVEAKIDPTTGKLFVPKGGSAPDDEDITLAEIEGEEKLQFKDKLYNASTYSGLGRTYLRKNMINSKNVLNQAMFTNDDGSVRSNARYIIQYDYDLNGATITIPEGCILDFQGGSLSNGVIIGEKTVIEASIVKIFNTDITLTGTWNIIESYAEWFGAKGDGITDDRLAIQKALNSFDIVELQNRVYYIASCTDGNISIKIGDGKSLIGVKRFDGDAFKTATIKIASASVIGNNVIAIACGAMCELKDFAIKGNNSPMDFGTTNQCCGITNIGTMNYKIKIEDVDIETFYYGVNISTWMSEFIRVGAKACKYGIAIHAYGSSSVHGVMDLNSPYSIVAEMTSNVLSQCYCNDCFINGYYLYGVIYSSIISCAADGCGTFVRANWEGYPDDMAKMDDSNTYHPYYFNKCCAVNMSACGSEGCVKLIQTVSCWNMTIDGIMVYMLSQEDFLYTNWIKSTNDNAVTFKNIRYYTIPWKLDAKFINVSGGAIELGNIVSADYGTYVSRRLVNVTNNASVVLLFFDEPEKIEITTLKDPGTNETFYNMYQLGDALKGFLKYKSNPKNVTYNVDVIGYGISIKSQSIKGWKDNLYLYGTSENTEKSNIHIIPSTNYGSTFENFNSIVFKNLWIYLFSIDYTLDYIFKFVDCPSVVFENVKFSNINISFITKWFESSGNTNIIFKNCTLPDSSVVEYAIWGGSDWVKFSSAALESNQA